MTKSEFVIKRPEITSSKPKHRIPSVARWCCLKPPAVSRWKYFGMFPAFTIRALGVLSKQWANFQLYQVAKKERHVQGLFFLPSSNANFKGWKFTMTQWGGRSPTEGKSQHVPFCSFWWSRRILILEPCPKMTQSSRLRLDLFVKDRNMEVQGQADLCFPQLIRFFSYSKDSS